tara:strand:- start:597 stop:719 length:123 start_codon:yes stop_codon:yes gene_type:complete
MEGTGIFIGNIDEIIMISKETINLKIFFLLIINIEVLLCL